MAYFIETNDHRILEVIKIQYTLNESSYNKKDVAFKVGYFTLEHLREKNKLHNSKYWFLCFTVNDWSVTNYLGPKEEIVSIDHIIQLWEEI